MFGLNKAAKSKIDKSTAQVLELETVKKKLEMDNEQIQLELSTQNRRFQMKLEEEEHKHKLRLETEIARFNREKEYWQKDKQELLDKAAKEKKEFEESLKRQFELKTEEAVTLVKLDAQQKIKQAELDKERAIAELKAEYAEKVAKIQAETAETHYNKLTNAFQELQMKGDKNSQFIQELALKMFDNTPKHTHKTQIEFQGIESAKSVE